MKGPVASKIEKAEEDRVKNWEHKPRIKSIFTPQKTQLKLLVTPFGTNKRYWVFVSGGAAGKTYSVKKADYMTVRTGYRAKTQPNNKYGGRGDYTGNVYRAKTVRWPGIEPRNFEEHIIKKHQKSVERLMHKAVQRAIRIQK